MRNIKHHLSDNDWTSTKCSVKHYHEAKRSLLTQNKIGELVVDIKYPTKSAALSSETRSSMSQRLAQDEEADIFHNVESKLTNLTTRLINDISEQVFDLEDVKIFSNTKVILDIKHQGN